LYLQCFHTTDYLIFSKILCFIFSTNLHFFHLKTSLYFLVFLQIHKTLPFLKKKIHKPTPCNVVICGFSSCFAKRNEFIFQFFYFFILALYKSSVTSVSSWVTLFYHLQKFAFLFVVIFRSHCRCIHFSILFSNC